METKGKAQLIANVGIFLRGGIIYCLHVLSRPNLIPVLLELDNHNAPVPLPIPLLRPSSGPLAWLSFFSSAIAHVYYAVYTYVAVLPLSDMNQQRGRPHALICRIDTKVL